MSSSETQASLRSPDDDEVHAWMVVVSEALGALPVVERFLSRPEQEKAGQFVYPADRNRYILTHGLLRILLGRYLGVSPEKIEFNANAFGKPGLVFAESSYALSFNLSHSDDVIVYAFTLRRKVGIDVEKIRPEVKVMELATSQFADEEIRSLQAYAPIERPDAFFRGWTRKEAYVKARGEGLSFPLNKFAVTLHHTESVQVLWAEDDARSASTWSMFNLDLYPGYAAAMVVEGQSVQVVSRRWKRSECASAFIPGVCSGEVHSCAGTAL
jgi:4'-phosphopantetheinyl transferase